MDDVMICRCEEVTESEIRKAIQAGAHSMADVKRRTGAGMGLCQGRTCCRLVSGIICQETGKTPAELMPDTVRPPVRPVAIGCLLNPGVK
ncbi:(2Fe-2S)-binding protein [Sporomusa sp.]|uniref:(2Fe-2S)-binding protein n=1 Tax=Sporomusa sp. TaxID=2078658 RepID=UPI002D03B651|nr:(2Fe-2S)-binding protein [Sporomusa sp.]HWR44735.1 (2Fe-2S)-binding protein [Sporomusa sp.]